MSFRMLGFTLATLVAASSMAFAVPGADVYEACYASLGELPGAEARACRTVEQVINGLGSDASRTDAPLERRKRG